MSEVTDEVVLRDHLDLEMLERPHLWPSVALGRASSDIRGLPTCFVKRGNPAHETGPCMQHKDGYVVLCHDWDNAGAVTVLHYDSAEAIVADGWRVD